MRPFVMSKKMKVKHQSWQDLGLVADPPQTWDDWERLCRQGGALIRRSMEGYRPDDESSRRRRAAEKKRRMRRAAQVQNLNVGQHFSDSG